jgi:hypothetical protein
MTKMTSLLAISGALLMLGTFIGPTEAQAIRTFVSGTGVDAGTCSRVAPCRTFAFAITKTAPSGEIDVLDPADYGAVAITKSISIANDGVGVAGIQVGSGGTGVTINAGTDDSINLRGLTIDGAAALAEGIVFNTGRSLTLTNCTILHIFGNGIALYPTGVMDFLISNVLVSDNASAGIMVIPQGAGTAKGTIDHVAANNNAAGIFVSGGSTTGAPITVAIVGTVVSNNGFGVFSDASSSHAATSVMVVSSVVNNNSTGLFVNGAGTMRLTRSVATGNAQGALVESVLGATLFSYGDNDIDGNGTDILGTLTAVFTR